MTVEQMKIPVAEVNIKEPDEGLETYALTQEGVVVPRKEIEENPEAFQDAME